MAGHITDQFEDQEVDYEDLSWDICCGRHWIERGQRIWQGLLARRGEICERSCGRNHNEDYTLVK